MLRVNKFIEGINYDLALAPQPWYENLGDGILCWVEDKPIPLVVYKYDTGATNWPLKTGTGNADQFRIEECTPLTPEEAMKYTAKQ